MMDAAWSTMRDIASWLLMPASGASAHDIAPGIAWHGRLMVLAWLVLMPLALLVARFYKVMPKQDWPRVTGNPTWFVAHRVLGYGIGAVVVVAIIAVLRSHGWRVGAAGFHAWAGWVVLAFTVVMVAGALFRGTHGGPVDPFTGARKPEGEWPGDHFSMTRRRVIFETIHKYAGYVLLPFAVVALATGLHAADAPRWMWIGAVLMLMASVATFIRLQRRGRCIDTYQAIWGIDPDLPGNRRARPIGFGIRRIIGRDGGGAPPA